MPIYKLKCPACEVTETVICKMADRKNQKCSACDSALEPLVTACSFALKGGSWYRDGYQEKPPKKEKPSVDATTEKITAPEKT